MEIILGLVALTICAYVLGRLHERRRAMSLLASAIYDRRLLPNHVPDETDEWRTVVDRYERS